MSKKDAAKATQEVAVKKAQDLAVAFDMGEDVGAGLEGTDKDSFAIPFLYVLQKGSPQADEANDKYVEGAKQGQFINSVTQERFDGKTGLIFLPCSYQRRFLRWGPRKAGGGFKGEFLPEVVAEMRENGVVKEQDGKLYFPKDGVNGYDKDKVDTLRDTRSHFGLILDEEGNVLFQCILPLGSTQIKKSKRLVSLLSGAKVKGPNGMVTPPTWAVRVRLTTIPESNDQGSWMGVEVATDGFVASQELYDAGKKFHALITAGTIKANYAASEDGDHDSDGAAPAGKF